METSYFCLFFPVLYFMYQVVHHGVASRDANATYILLAAAKNIDRENDSVTMLKGFFASLKLNYGVSLACIEISSMDK